MNGDLVNGAVLASLAPGFKLFLAIVAFVAILAIVLAIIGGKGGPHAARTARVLNRYVLLTLIAVIVLFPIYITLVNSLLAPDRIAARPPTLFPSNPQWGAYSDAWNQGHVGSYLRNSFIVTVIIVTGQLLTSILAAYAFAFLEFPFKRIIFVLFLTTMMIPGEVVFFTNLDTVSSFGNIPGIGKYIGFNTYGALALPFLAIGFGAFLLRQAFLALPRDLKDAAALDGYGHMRFLARVAVPLSRPAIASLALFSFFAAWNQYLWPLVVTDENHRTIQVGLKFLRSAALDQINITFAGTVLAAVPLFILLLVFQKQLVRGLTAGAVKG